MIIHFIFISLHLFSFVVNGLVNKVCENPTVEIKNGTYIGRYRTTEKNVTYASFEGISYAEPPIGNLRFKDPVLVQDLQGTFNAVEFGPLCIQPNTSLIYLNPDAEGVQLVGSEDCLTVNVYVPLSLYRPKRGFPIVFYIHGGGFLRGGPNAYNPELLVETGFIYVSLNYRLGVLGFLSLDTKDVPGNAGVKDQTICLRWIRKNIKYFGGDADNVLLAGGSAGAASVRLQQLSPMAKGLFCEAVSISGSALDDWTIQTRPAEKAAQLADILGLDMSDPSFLDNLQSLNPEDIAHASLQVQPFKPGIIQDFAFTPVVENKYKGKEAFLTMMPMEYYKTGKYNHVPSIIGCSSKEGIFFNSDIVQLTAILNSPNTLVPINWHNYLTDDAVIYVGNIIKLFYFGKLNFDLTNRDDFESAIDLYGDVGIFKPTHDSVRILAKTSRKPIYYYVFSFTGDLNGFYMLPLGLIGATHINEELFIFPSESPRIGEYTPDGWTRRRFLKIYENFSKTGDPTPGNCTHLLPTKWLPATKTDQNYLEINGALTPSVNPAECRMRFWRELEYKVFSGAFN